MRGAVVGSVLVGLGAVLPAPAAADPPRQAFVRDNVGMAGVRVGTRVALDRMADPPRVTRGPMSDWGPVAGGFCFEGVACRWDVPGGGSVGVTLNARTDRLLELWTTSPRWTTSRGVNVGDTVSRAQRRYGGRLSRERTCALGGFGAELDVLVLRGRRRSTAFEIERGRVDTIWVAAQRLPLDDCERPARITAAGVGPVRLGASFRALRRAGHVGALRVGCELAGPEPRSAALRPPLRGSVDFARGPRRGVTNVFVTGGATARGVAIGDRTRAVRRAYPRVRFDHATDEVFGVTLATVPRGAGGRLQFAIDTDTRRVVSIGIPFIAFCE